VKLNRRMPRRIEMSNWVEIRAADPIEAGANTLVPLTKVVRVYIPGWLSGVIWNRPIAVVVNTGDEEQVLPIKDLTRVIQFWIFGSGLLLFLFAWLYSRRRCVV